MDRSGEARISAAISAINGIHSPTAASPPLGFPAAAKLAIIGRSANSSSAWKPTCKLLASTPPSPTTNSRTPGSAPCAAAAGSPSTLNNILFYATLGLAYGRGQLDVAGLSGTNLHTGLAAGFGLEVGLTHNWSVKAEGLFNDYGNQPYAVIGTNGALTNGAAQLGVDYRFGLTNSVARLGVNSHDSPHFK
jgi:hypothetical protein